jgi:hypothetical protein
VQNREKNRKVIEEGAPENQFTRPQALIIVEMTAAFSVISHTYKTYIASLEAYALMHCTVLETR